ARGWWKGWYTLVAFIWGPQKELMPPQGDNPDGFWEHLGFVALNDELLNELGGAWDLPPKPDENFAHWQLDPVHDKARLLIESFDSARVWGWQDPRNSLTLPFWQKLLRALKTLIVVRNPLEVGHSMRRRNGTSYAFGLRLWEIYNRRLIEKAKNQQGLVTHYDLLFEDAKSELLRIAQSGWNPNLMEEHERAVTPRVAEHAPPVAGVERGGVKPVVGWSPSFADVKARSMRRTKAITR